jgi:AraC family transcriptional activator FtrA
MIDSVRDKAANAGSGPRGARAPSSRTVAVIVYDEVSPLELGVACDVFGPSSGAVMGQVPWYRLAVCSAHPSPVSVNGGFMLQAPHRLAHLTRADTVVVLPTESLDRVPPEVFDALRRAHAAGSRIVSLCTGAFVLAQAGLLDGRRVTTHWMECAHLAGRYPAVSVDPGVLYVDDGDILSSAGSAASIDLCLHIVRQDYGTDLATQLARQLVVPPQREGGQAQFIDTPLPSLDADNLFTSTVTWVQEHLNEPLSVNDLAARSAMSPRTFARRFQASTGTTPHQWLLRQRVHLAQRLLETTDLPMDAVAASSGFGTAGNLRKHFHRIVQTSPQDYRRTFQDRTRG